MGWFVALANTNATTTERESHLGADRANGVEGLVHTFYMESDNTTDLQLSCINKLLCRCCWVLSYRNAFDHQVIRSTLIDIRIRGRWCLRTFFGGLNCDRSRRACVV